MRSLIRPVNRASRSEVSLRVEDLRLAGGAAELLLRLAEPLDLLVCKLERREQHVLGDLLCAALDHGDGVLRPDDEQVERRRLLLGKRRIDDQAAVVVHPDPDGADGPEEGQRGDHERRRRAVDAEHVVTDDLVGRQDGRDDLHLVLEPLRPQRPDRPVDHPGGQDGPFGRAPLPLEEAAGDLARRVHTLLDVHRQREEVRTLAGLGSPLRRGQHHRVARPDDHGAVGLLREVSGLEPDLTSSYGTRDRVPLGSNHRHVPSLPLGQKEAEV